MLYTRCVITAAKLLKKNDICKFICNLQEDSQNLIRIITIKEIPDNIRTNGRHIHRNNIPGNRHRANGNWCKKRTSLRYVDTTTLRKKKSPKVPTLKAKKQKSTAGKQQKSLHAAWATPALSTSRAGRHLWRPYGAEDKRDRYRRGMGCI